MQFDNVQFLTVGKFASILANAPYNTEFTISFDDEYSLQNNGEMEGLYGVKITTIFDEYDGVLCFGYYGGGSTRCVELYEISDDTNSITENSKAIENQLLEWFSEHEFNNKKICVAVENHNKEYMEKFIEYAEVII